MQRIISFISCLSWFSIVAQEDFSVQLEPRWQDLDKGSVHAQHFPDKTILIGSITFKKNKAKELIHLSRIYLHWHGDQIAQLFGSLYKKLPDKDFIPIQEFLVCDGKWNRKAQTLMLDFDQQQSLGYRNTFYLVLTIPAPLEAVIKKGKFELVAGTLPEPFQSQRVPLSLSLDAVGSQVTLP